MFNHSINYHSLVILGRASPVEGDEKLHALEVMAEHILPGRWSDARAPSPGELEASIVLKLMISEASAKIRTGPPLDDEPDYKLPHWAGVIPIAYRAGEPIPEERIHPDAKIPDYIRRFVARMNMQK
jgi:hypothetical protein